jgi:hypothetical protein
MQTHELNSNLLLDHKFILPKYAIDIISGSGCKRKMAFMSSTENPSFLSGADKKTMAKVEEEFEILKKLSLDEGLAILFLKEDQSNGSPSPEGSSLFHVLEEADPEDERRDSVVSLDSFELTSESDSSDVGSANVQRKGTSLGSRRGVNRPRNHAASRLGRVSHRSSRGSRGRNANRSARRGVATGLSRGRTMKKRR